MHNAKITARMCNLSLLIFSLIILSSIVLADDGSFAFGNYPSIGYDEASTNYQLGSYSINFTELAFNAVATGTPEKPLILTNNYGFFSPGFTKNYILSGNGNFIDVYDASISTNLRLVDSYDTGVAAYGFNEVGYDSDKNNIIISQRGTGQPMILLFNFTSERLQGIAYYSQLNIITDIKCSSYYGHAYNTCYGINYSSGTFGSLVEFNLSSFNYTTYNGFQRPQPNGLASLGDFNRDSHLDFAYPIASPGYSIADLTTHQDIFNKTSEACGLSAAGSSSFLSAQIAQLDGGGNYEILASCLGTSAPKTAEIKAYYSDGSSYNRFGFCNEGAVQCYPLLPSIGTSTLGSYTKGHYDVCMEFLLTSTVNYTCKDANDFNTVARYLDPNFVSLTTPQSSTAADMNHDGFMDVLLGNKIFYPRTNLTYNLSVGTDAFTIAADINADQSVEVVNQKASQLSIDYSTFVNGYPVFLPLVKFFTVNNIEYLLPVCLNTSISYYAVENTQYTNDVSTDLETLHIKCNSSDSFAAGLPNANNPYAPVCIYNKTGIYQTEICITDDVNTNVAGAECRVFDVTVVNNTQGCNYNQNNINSSPSIPVIPPSIKNANQTNLINSGLQSLDQGLHLGIGLTALWLLIMILGIPMIIFGAWEYGIRDFLLVFVTLAFFESAMILLGFFLGIIGLGIILSLIFISLLAVAVYFIVPLFINQNKGV